MTISQNKLSTLDVTKNTKLVGLFCDFNNLTQLDVTKNTLLVGLNCASNNLTVLDVTQTTKLNNLSCQANGLSSLDLTKNTELTSVRCNSNQITALNLDNCTKLTTLLCHFNKLASLDINKNILLNTLSCTNNVLTYLNLANGNNTGIIQMLAGNNSTLTCIKIDADYTPGTGWNKDATASYNTACPLMDTDEVRRSEIIIQNPIEKELTYSSKEKIDKIDVYSVDGKLIRSVKDNNRSMLSFSAGMYFAKIYFHNGKVITKKLVKK